ncbi:MAG TPA: response regulator transcription factor [Anaerolineales bacterium]|nr:response regulator transcription factor [Anaerolineales bacterium]
MGEPISVMIVDDHEVVRKGIRAYLESTGEFQVVGEVGSGRAALEQIGDLVPDVVLMDLIMPEMDGIKTTREIKKISPRSQVVVLTSFHEDIHIFPALKAGAISYILKDVKMEDLAEALKRAARHEVTFHPLVAERVLRSIRGDDPNDEQLYVELTARELEILKLIANARTNSQIAETLVISEYTVKGYVSNILSKLHLVDRTQAAVYAWQKGLVQRED